MRIYVWDTSGLRDLGMIIPPKVGNEASDFIKREFMKNGRFFSHELVREELKNHYYSSRNREGPISDGDSRAYEWVKYMKEWRLLRDKEDPKVLAIVSKMVQLNNILHEKKKKVGLTVAERKIKNFLNDNISRSVQLDSADFYVIGTALVLEQERKEEVYIVARDQGMKDFVENIDKVKGYLGIERTNIKIVDYKGFFELEDLSLCARFKSKLNHPE